MKGSTNRRLRRLHQYLGLFFAPTLLLFALSGALQTYRWQEPQGYGGAPPHWVVWLASVHKDQALPRAAGEKSPPEAEGAAKGPPPGAASPPAKAAEHKGPGRRQGLMLFVGLFGLALIGSTLLGIAVALANAATRRTSLLVLAGGAALPLLLLYL